MLCGYYYIGGVDTFHIPSVPNKILVFDNRSRSSFDEESHLVGGTSIAVDSLAVCCRSIEYLVNFCKIH
jgi:hypothetical protein